MEGWGGIVLINVAVGGKRSHLFPSGKDVVGTRSLVPGGVPNSRYFCFFFCREFVCTYVPGTHQPTMVVYS